MGVVVLSNAEAPQGVDNIARHLLDAKVLLWPPPGERKEVRVDPKIFDGYMRY